MYHQLALDQTPYNPVVTRALPAAVALALHAAVQVREPYAHHFVVGVLAAWAAVTRWLMGAWHVDVWEANRATAEMFGVFVATVFTSMAIYRVWLHPLRNIPGPLSCKLSMWTWVRMDWFGGRQYAIQEMHKKYGPMVRIGPREVSVADPRALAAIYGPTGGAQKSVRGPWYGAQSMIPHVHSLQNEPTIADHNKRRRDWDPAFSIKALETYQPNIVRNTDALIEQIGAIASRSGGRIDMRLPLMWWGFDLMGELGFGRSFGTLKDGKTSHEVHLVELGVRAINTLGDIPYIAHIMRFLPSPIHAFEKWLAEAIEWRRGKQGDREYVATDVMAYLLGEEGATKHKGGDPRNIQQDCMLLVVAGSDTTSNTLAFCLFELARQPRLVERLRQEVEQFAADDFAALRDDAPFLNACLTETLRLWPAVPSGLQRETTVATTLPGDVSIPAKSVLSTHTWSMHRDSNNFYKPDRFIPERWIEKDKKKPFNEKAFSPFGYGATSCIGKNLAYMEMRLALAHFVLKFDFNMEPSDAQDFRNSIRDQFVAAADALWMNVTPR